MATSFDCRLLFVEDGSRVLPNSETEKKEEGEGEEDETSGALCKGNRQRFPYLLHQGRSFCRDLAADVP